MCFILCKGNTLQLTRWNILTTNHISCFNCLNQTTENPFCFFMSYTIPIQCSIAISKWFKTLFFSSFCVPLIGTFWNLLYLLIQSKDSNRLCVTLQSYRILKRFKCTIQPPCPKLNIKISYCFFRQLSNPEFCLVLIYIHNINMYCVKKDTDRKQEPSRNDGTSAMAMGLIAII